VHQCKPKFWHFISHIPYAWSTPFPDAPLENPDPSFVYSAKIQLSQHIQRNASADPAHPEKTAIPPVVPLIHMRAKAAMTRGRPRAGREIFFIVRQEGERLVPFRVRPAWTDGPTATPISAPVVQETAPVVQKPASIPDPSPDVPIPSDLFDPYFEWYTDQNNNGNAFESAIAGFE
jgi:hypothetical protein